MPTVLNTVRDIFGSRDVTVPNPMLNRIEYLSNGAPMPVLGVTTWVYDKTVPDEIRGAIEKGFLQIEVSTVYKNEELIGRGIKEAIEAGKVKRSDLFVVLKIWLHDIGIGSISHNFNESLAKLNLKKVDMLVAHTSAAYNKFSENEVKSIWRQMDKIYISGRTSSIGVANWTEKQIESAMSLKLTDVHLSQKELDLYYKRNSHVDFCEVRHIACSKFVTLGSLDHLNCTILTGFGSTPLDFNDSRERHVINLADWQQKTPEQVTLLHAVENGFIHAPHNMDQSKIDMKYHVGDKLGELLSTKPFDMMFISNMETRFVKMIVTPMSIQKKKKKLLK